MIWILLASLALACVFLALSLAVDRVIARCRPIERRWRR